MAKPNHILEINNLSIGLPKEPIENTVEKQHKSLSARFYVSLEKADLENP